MILKLSSKPLSVNKLYYANKKHGLRRESVEWQCNIFQELSKYEAFLGSLRARFNPKKNCYAVKLTHVVPKEYMYTKSGEVSNRMCDISNVEKALIDCLFLPKHFSSNVPYGCQNLNIDDKYLKRLTSQKVVGTKWEILVQIKIVLK